MSEAHRNVRAQRRPVHLDKEEDMNMLITQPLEITIDHRESIRGVGAGIWRVTDQRNLVLGNIRALPESLGVRYHAMRFHAPTASFRSVGAFWSPDEALVCLRYSR